MELSDQYDRPMLRVDGEVRELVEQDVKDILPQRSRDEIFSHAVILALFTIRKWRSMYDKEKTNTSRSGTLGRCY